LPTVREKITKALQNLEEQLVSTAPPHIQLEISTKCTHASLGEQQGGCINGGHYQGKGCHRTRQEESWRGFISFELVLGTYGLYMTKSTVDL
jgi:hypothetical protein